MLRWISLTQTQILGRLKNSRKTVISIKSQDPVQCCCFWLSNVDPVFPGHQMRGSRQTLAQKIENQTSANTLVTSNSWMPVQRVDGTDITHHIPYPPTSSTVSPITTATDSRLISKVYEKNANMIRLPLQLMLHKWQSFKINCRNPEQMTTNYQHHNICTYLI